MNPIVVNLKTRSITFEDAPGFYGSWKLRDDGRIEVSIHFRTTGVCVFDPETVGDEPGVITDAMARAAGQCAELAAEQAEKALAERKLWSKW